jgi:hypothetical protein
VVGFTHFPKKLLKLLVEVLLGHSAFMLISLPSLVKPRFLYLSKRRKLLCTRLPLRGLLGNSRHK